MTFKNTGAILELSDTVQSGQSKTYFLPNRGKPVSVSVAPGAGGSVTLEHTCGSRDAIVAGTCIWVTYGTFTAESGGGSTSDPVTAYRVSAVTADARVEIAQVA